METYKKIEDLLNGETPYGFGRGVYKGVGCGPWVSYVMKNGKDIYYGDTKEKLPKGCIGVKVGSIVEGSDVEIGPETLLFPFTDETFWEVVENIDKEANFYWERDNTNNYKIAHNGKEVGIVTWTGFDSESKWFEDKKIPKTIKQKWEKWNGEMSFWPIGEPIEFAKGWTTEEFIKDLAGFELR